MRHSLHFVALSFFLACASFVPGCSSKSAKPAVAPADAATTVYGPLGDVAGLPVTSTSSLQNLSGPVDVVRDKWGRPHIYATSVTDALRVEGYLVALDRTMQLEFYRRVAEGRLAELFSDLDASLIDLDISYRQIGLARTAQAEYAALPAGPVHDALDAYADGITQAYHQFQQNPSLLPGVIESTISPSAFTDWTGVDSLAVARFETYELSYDADLDVDNQAFFDAARMTFTATSSNPAVAKRAGLERDLFRFAPADPTTTTMGYPIHMTTHHGATPPPVNAGPAIRGAAGYIAALKKMRHMFKRAGFGSNNWAISPSRSATGHSLVASDPHLSLSAPSVFWPVSIHVAPASAGQADASTPDSSGPDGSAPITNLDVGGIAFPGIPAIILGHNDNVAWGATVAGYDVSDAYSETLTADGKSVIFNGKPVAIQTINEVINVQSGPPVDYVVQVVPQHGPILPTIVDHKVVPPTQKTGAISIRWTGLEATHELEAIFELLSATDVDSARTALNDFGVGAQNWMIGDNAGHILWTSHAIVPTRDRRAFQWDASSYTGNLPCFILPGDGTAEWTGALADDLVPWQKDPAAGYISTANNDPIGNTLDNDPSNDTLPDGTPMYLACTYDLGFREGKIHKRIEAHTSPLVTADLSTIQGDEQSSLGTNLAPALVLALEAAEAEKKTPGTHPDLTTVVGDPAYVPSTIAAVQALMTTWGAGGYLAASGVDPDDNTPLPATGSTATEASNAEATLIFNAWQERLLNRTFDDELAMMGQSYSDPQEESRAILRLVNAPPKTLATYDPSTGDSALWDDLGTPTVTESRNDRMVRALLDALTDLATVAGSDITKYRWGALHTITFEAILPLWSNLSIPPSNDPVFGATGFPRHCDSYCIDAADFTFVPLGTSFDFTYGAGPTQRFVVDMAPTGPSAMNTLPGGEIWDPSSSHFADEAELWRRNEVHPIPFALPDVIADEESRTVMTPP